MADPASSPARHPVSVHVGTAIRARRKACGLTQNDLGERVGVTHTQIQKYENGASRMSTVGLYDIALALDCSVGDLFVGLSGLPPQAALEGDAPGAAAQEARLWAELRDAARRLSPEHRKALIRFVNSLPRIADD